MPIYYVDDTSGAAAGSSGAIAVVEQQAPVAEDNANGVYGEVLKPVATNTYAPGSAPNLGAATAGNAKTTAGNVIGLTCSNANAAVRFFQIHNTTAAPSGGAVPLWEAAVFPNQTLVIPSFPGSGLFCSTGISWAISTTIGTYTAATATDHASAFFYK